MQKCTLYMSVFNIVRVIAITRETVSIRCKETKDVMMRIFADSGCHTGHHSMINIYTLAGLYPICSVQCELNNNLSYKLLLIP
jgi:hypothetical protein